MLGCKGLVSHEIGRACWHKGTHSFSSRSPPFIGSQLLGEVSEIDAWKVFPLLVTGVHVLYILLGVIIPVVGGHLKRAIMLRGGFRVW